MSTDPLEQLNELQKLIDAMSPDEKAEWQRGIVESISAAKTAKTEEQLPVTGTCRGCGGMVIADYEMVHFPSWNDDIIGPGGGRSYHRKLKDYHCTRCGICYAFLPPDDAEKKDE